MKPIKILVVDDEVQQRELLSGYLSRRKFEVTTASGGEEALEKYASVFSPLAIIDMKMPGMSGIELLGKLRELNPFIQVLVLTAFGSVETAVAAMRAGAYDYLTKPVEDLEELLIKLEKAAAQNQLIVDHAVMSERIAEAFPNSELIGESTAIRKVKELVAQVAKSDATVLVTGASGTGKELVARELHALSGRAEKRLVAINCAAFPETLLEAELFGYEKGAFTGADKAKQGRMELADGGTLFLDEIGEMPLTMQVKLLRILEDRKIQRLGAMKEISLDFRLIAATNRDLELMIKEGKFREDLFYRLNVIRVTIPPLRERGGDILILARTFLQRSSRRLGRDLTGFSPEAVSLLSNYGWPGNVRELENIIERAVVVASGRSITAADLTGLTPTSGEQQSAAPRTLEEVEKEHIKRMLEQTDWNVVQAAEILGVHRNTLHNKIKEFKLERS
ncbi:MAG: sigma-54-dependent Fis family transcriptional regulator [bacterium]|nr:sigma-54-dependent Fis family transcriptional regulator [bacterium]